MKIFNLIIPQYILWKYKFMRKLQFQNILTFSRGTGCPTKKCTLEILFFGGYFLVAWISIEVMFCVLRPPFIGTLQLNQQETYQLSQPNITTKLNLSWYKITTNTKNDTTTNHHHRQLLSTNPPPLPATTIHHHQLSWQSQSNLVKILNKINAHYCT